MAAGMCQSELRGGVRHLCGRFGYIWRPVDRQSYLAVYWVFFAMAQAIDDVLLLSSKAVFQNITDSEPEYAGQPLTMVCRAVELRSLESTKQELYTFSCVWSDLPRILTWNRQRKSARNMAPEVDTLAQGKVS